MKKIALVLIIALIAFVAGLTLSFHITMHNIRAYTEDEGIIILDVYGQEYVYEE